MLLKIKRFFFTIIGIWLTIPGIYWRNERFNTILPFMAIVLTGVLICIICFYVSIFGYNEQYIIYTQQIYVKMFISVTFLRLFISNLYGIICVVMTLEKNNFASFFIFLVIGYILFS